ncbi:putative spore germination protein GerPD [Robertmurraya siralis]|uniref:Spore germination protein GerPD n=1 Tax=Robertmurraya siralis TaxID=77777 RepID=A0A919WJH5_9BACI|nr:spore gernimation protein GerPD [Robertmurraya siralis]PAE20776.1 spore gernimation protein GerPD [Bacillus sp. 7504-2]GIN62904.1 putative spore germination protein GerPD [Robertmurraya siralis]
MNLQIYNEELQVGNMQVEAVSSSSIVLIGDAETIQLSSIFDTPAESLIIGPFVPLNPQG